MSKKKLLLIGKNSFIANNLHLHLKKKISIKKISFEKFYKIKQKDLIKFDFICNCSIKKNYINSKYQRQNDLDLIIANKIKRLSPKFIFLSSRKVYLPKPNLKENNFLKPLDNYAKNKLITENKLKKKLNSNLLILRISNLIGPPLKKKNTRKISKTFIDNFYNFENNQVILYENHFKDFLSIKKFCEIFFKILKVNPSGVFNVSLGKKIYINEVLNVLNKNKSIRFKKIKITKKDSFYLNNKKLKKIIKIKITKKELLDYCSKM